MSKTSTNSVAVVTAFLVRAIPLRHMIDPVVLPTTDAVASQAGARS